MFIRVSTIAGCCLTALLSVSSCFAQTPPSGESEKGLRSGFMAPPQQARLWCYWWWLNGNTSDETITRDLTEMSRKGFGGVLLVDANGASQNGNSGIPSGPEFGSADWTKLYRHALQVASSLHLQVTLNITSGWNLGGPDVVPAQASKLLTWSRETLTEGSAVAVLEMPPTKNGYYQQIAVLAYPLAHGVALPGEPGSGRNAIRDLKFKSASSEMSFSMPATDSLLVDVPTTQGEQDADVASVIDITAQVDESGHFAWSPPSKGPWEILRIGYTDSGAKVSTSSGKWQGLAIDYLDRGAFDTYWDHTVVPLLDVARPYLATTLVNLATDSWELGGTNWTGRFAGEFKTRRGYDPIRYLPIVAGRILDNRGTSDEFLNDLRRTVGDLVTDHYDHFAERAKSYGLGIQCESGGPHGAPFDGLETFRSAAVPQTEYWAKSAEHRSTDQDRYFTKEAASAADIYGKKFVAQEGMTSIGPQWSESLSDDLKPSFDQALTEGMNRLIWHEFTSSPASFGLPGNEYFAGTHLNPNVTWWSQGDAFFRYLNRSQWLMQQGRAVDDVLYFYGNNVPNFARLKSDDPAHVLPGYDYDVTNEDALVRTLVVGDGRITSPAGNPYRVLVMPNGRRVSIQALERIAAYVQQGGVIVGQPPIGPTGVVTADVAMRFSNLSQAVWNSCSSDVHTYGSGTVYCTSDTRKVLHQLNVEPDFSDQSGKLDYVHRIAAGNDIYFIRNGTDQSIDSIIQLRATGGAPELWDAIDGSIKKQVQFEQKKGSTELPIHLAPFGSIFILFETDSKPNLSTVSNNTKPSAIVTSENLPASQWSIAFQADRGAPSGPQNIDGFRSWSESSDLGIRYFSGTAVYRTQIKMKRVAGERIFLKLDDVHEVCTVRLNGKQVDTIWAKPYRLELTDDMRDGINTLELEVTNLWPNRLIGDAQPGVTRTYTHTNIRKYTAVSPLLPSGLIGHVTLEKIGASESAHP